MQWHRSSFILLVLAALLTGCSSEPSVNLGDPAKEAAAIQERPETQYQGKRKPTKPPAAPRDSSTKPSDTL